MKLTILFALGTTLVTLAQKPTLEPQKDWSKERTQLWLDSLVKSLSQDTKILSNTTQNLSEQPPARTREQEAADAEFKRISEMPPNYTIDGMPHYIPESDKKATEWAKKKTLFESQKYERAAKTIKDAEFIFEGFPVPLNNNLDFYSKDKKTKYDVNIIHINKIYKGNGLKEGFIILIQPYIINSDFLKFSIGSNSNYFWFCNKSKISNINSKSLENNIQLEIINYGNGGDKKYNGITLFKEIRFLNRIELYNYLKKYINIDAVDNSCDKNIENHNYFYYDIRELIEEKKNTKKNPYKNFKPLNNFLRIESSATTFSFNPTIIRAGTSEFLTISGIGFGNTFLGVGGLVSFPGLVRFKNSDTGGKDNVVGFENSGYLTGLNLQNYIQWTDTQIIVKIPSWVNGSFGIGKDFRNTPGSGLVKIQLNNGTELTSTGVLDIEYAVRADTILGNRVFYANYNCKNGHIFRLEAGIAGNSARVKAIEKALRTWSDYLKMDLRLDRNADGSLITVSDASGGVLDDNISMIVTDPLPGSYAYTKVWEGDCTGKKYFQSPDIAIDTTNTFSYIDNENLYTYQKDFNAIFLHEMGHALGLGHVIDDVNKQKELMYGFVHSGNQVTATNRPSLNSGRGKAKAGSDNVMKVSKLQTWSCSGIKPLRNFVQPALESVGCVGSGAVPISVSVSGSNVAYQWQRYRETYMPPVWENRLEIATVNSGVATNTITIIAPSATLETPAGEP